MAELTEAKIGANAAKLLDTALGVAISQTNLEYSGFNQPRRSKSGQDITPMELATAKPRFIQDKGRKLRAIAIVMGKQGFIQNYGANTYRESHNFTSKKNKEFKRKGSTLRLKKQNFIPVAIHSSKIIPYLMNVLPEMQSKEIVSLIKSGIDG